MDTKIKVVPVKLTDAMRAATTHAGSFDEAWGLALAAVPEAPQADVKPVAWRFKEYEDNQRSQWLYTEKANRVPTGRISQELYARPDTVDIERCYDHALSAMEGEVDRLRAQHTRDSAEAAELQSYLVGTARTIRPVDGSGLFAWALAALKAQAVPS